MTHVRQPFERSAVIRGFLVSRFGLALAAVCCVAALAGCDRFRSADSRVARAEGQLASGEFRGAMTELKSVLEKEPEHSRARIALARLSLQLGDGESARKELDRAIGAGARREELLELDTEVRLAQGEFAPVVERLRTDRALPQARRLTLLGAAQLGLNDMAAAENSIAEAQKLAPEDARVLLQQAHINIAQQRFDPALKAVDRAIAIDPRLSQAWLLRGRLLMQQREFAEAIVALKKAREPSASRLTVPEELQRLASVAESQIALRETTAAAASVKQLKAAFPGMLPTHYLTARLALLENDYRTAAAELKQAARKQPDYVPVRLLLGAALLAQGTLEQAEAELSQLVSQHPENLEARKLLAQVHIAREQPELAKRVLSEGEGSDAQVDLLMGTALLQTGSAQAGLAHLERSLAAAPDNHVVRVQLASAYLSGGRREQALQLLEAAPADKRDLKLQQLIVLANILGKPGPEAKRALEQLAQSNNTAARIALAQIEAREGRLEVAERELRSALKTEPKNQEAHTALAGIAMARGDRAQARQWLEQSVAAYPAAIDARLRLAKLAFSDQDPKRARALLDQALTVSNNRPEVRNAVGEVLLSGGQFDEALAHFDAASKAGFQPAGFNAARAELALGRSSENARRLLLQRLKDNPQDRAIRRLLAQHYQTAGELGAAIVQYEQLLGTAKTPDAVLLNNLAWLYFESGDARGLELARKAYELAPDNAAVADTYGWILVGRNQAGAGIPILQKAAQRAPDNKEIQQHLAQARQRNGSSGSRQ